jgi:hypothetical protein
MRVRAKQSCLPLLAALLLPCAASAQRVSNVSGTTLLTACTGRSVTACDAYVDGFSDAIEAGGPGHALACIPRAATGTELRDVLVKFLKAHPEDQHLKAGTIASRAFSKAYACPK